MEERLGEGADDGRDRVGAVRVVLVEPDAVVAVERELGGVLVGDDPVDEQALAWRVGGVALEDLGEAGRLGHRLALELDDVSAPKSRVTVSAIPSASVAADGPQPASAPAATSASTLPSGSANGRAGGGGIARAL